MTDRKKLTAVHRSGAHHAAASRDKPGAGENTIMRHASGKAADVLASTALCWEAPRVQAGVSRCWVAHVQAIMLWPRGSMFAMLPLMTETATDASCKAAWHDGRVCWLLKPASRSMRRSMVTMHQTV